LVGIVVLMGLQAPSALSILPLIPQRGGGVLFSVQWFAASINLCIRHALDVSLRRDLYPVPFSMHFLASYLVLVAVYIWATCEAGSEWSFLQSLL